MPKVSPLRLWFGRWSSIEESSLPCQRHFLVSLKLTHRPRPVSYPDDVEPLACLATGKQEQTTSGPDLEQVSDPG
jgi:hypothetical protein